MLIPVHRSAPFAGWGYIGGNPPPVPNPDELDGRTFVQDALASMRVVAYFNTLDILEFSRQTISRPDGTWRLGPFPLDTRIAVLFVNDGQFLDAGDPINSHMADFILAYPYDDSGSFNIGRVPGNYVGCNLGDDATPLPPNSETSYVSL